MFIRGIGRTRFGVLPESLPELAAQAMTAALRDAGIEFTALDLVIVSNFDSGSFCSQLHLNALISTLLPESHLPVFEIKAACASGGAALYAANHFSSRFENILVLGIEKMSSLAGTAATDIISRAGDRNLDQAEGAIFPACYALMAQQHMLKYGTTEEDLARVALKNHQNANLNELAHFHGKKVSMQAISSSPVVCSPLRLFDCSPLSDGAAALVVSRKRHSDRDIRIAASTMATDSLSFVHRRDITTIPAAKMAARKAYAAAGLRPEDIGVAEVHDCFTIAELIAMEDLGFCAPGESAGLVREGATSLGGEMPINADGGLKADGHPIGASGIAQVCEIVRQLRGESGKRQVEDADIGLTHNVGGVGGTAVVHIFRR